MKPQKQNRHSGQAQREPESRAMLQPTALDAGFRRHDDCFSK